jgi:hypothetical protein
VGVTRDGRLQWVVPEATLGAEVIPAEEQRLINANRERLAELQRRVYPSPDLHDVIADVMAYANPPTLSLAVAGCVLHATGVVPMPIFGSAVMAAHAADFVRRELGHRLRAAEVPAEAADGAAQLWQTHAGLALSLLTILMDTVIDSIKNAIAVDDTALEDELDAFYPDGAERTSSSTRGAFRDSQTPNPRFVSRVASLTQAQPRAPRRRLDRSTRQGLGLSARPWRVGA